MIGQREYPTRFLGRRVPGETLCEPLPKKHVWLDNPVLAAGHGAHDQQRLSTFGNGLWQQ
jgi:hypothetical protein